MRLAILLLSSDRHSSNCCQAIALQSLERSYSVDAERSKKVSFHERNQYFPVSANRAVHGPSAEADAQPEATGHRVSIAKDVPDLRIDHISTKPSVLGM